MSVPACRDCVFADMGTVALCYHPRLTRVDIVEGRARGVTCYSARDALGACGPLGKLFDIKPPARWKFWQR